MLSGTGACTALASGNYVLASPLWNGYAGAATWVNGYAPQSGVVSAANSLVGSVDGDLVGFPVDPLPNGNYVVRDPTWNGNRGAITWGRSTAGVVHPVSAANSLIGSAGGDLAGVTVTPLAGGGYVVASPSWNNAIAL